MLQIGFSDKFDGAVHVAIGDGNQSRGAACTSDLNSGGVITGWISEGVDLERDIASCGLSSEQFEHDRAGIGTTNEHRAASNFDPAEFILINSGAVGSVGDIDCDGDIGGDSEGAGCGASQPDFFLNGGYGDNFAGGRSSGDLSQGLHDDPDSCAVVHGDTGQSTVAEFAEAGFGCDEVADPDDGAGFCFGYGADIDPEVLHFRYGFAFIGVEQVDRFACDDAWYRTGCGVDEHALTEEDLEVPATDRVDSQKPVAVDVADNESDLIAVCVEQDGASPCGVDNSVDAAMYVGCDLIGEL